MCACLYERVIFFHAYLFVSRKIDHRDSAVWTICKCICTHIHGNSNQMCKMYWIIYLAINVNEPLISRIKHIDDAKRCRKHSQLKIWKETHKWECLCACDACMNVYVHFMYWGIFQLLCISIYSRFEEENSKLKYTQVKHDEMKMIVVDVSVCVGCRKGKGVMRSDLKIVHACVHIKNHRKSSYQLFNIFRR